MPDSASAAKALSSDDVSMDTVKSPKKWSRRFITESRNLPRLFALSRYPFAAQISSKTVSYLWLALRYIHKSEYVCLSYKCTRETRRSLIATDDHILRVGYIGRAPRCGFPFQIGVVATLSELGGEAMTQEALVQERHNARVLLNKARTRGVNAVQGFHSLLVHTFVE